MRLTVQRYDDDGHATLGKILIDGALECYSLEDTHRAEKVKGETRIPAGAYRLELKGPSRFDDKASRELGAEHIGMIRLVDVPGFTEILIHWGNYAKDTEGCVLTGQNPAKDGQGHNVVWNSMDAYKALYRKVAPLLRCEVVMIEVIDEVTA